MTIQFDAQTPQSKSYLALVAVFGFATLIGAWLVWTSASPLWSWITAALGVLTMIAVGRVWREWRRNTSLVVSAKVVGRLALFTVGVSALAVFGATAWIAHDRAYNLVHPSRSLPACPPGDFGLTDYRAVSFPTADGLLLRGWYVPAHNGAVIIMVHGHAGNRCELLPEAGFLVEAGYGVLLYDSRSSGESEGTLSTLGLLEVADVQGAVQFVLTQTDGVGRIGLMGHSQGGGTVIRAGARLPAVSAVIAESAYTSLEDNISTGVQKLLGLPPFPFAPLVVFFGQREAGMDITQVRPIDDIAALSPRPILLIHGAQDEVIPVSNAYSLYAVASEPKELYVIPTAAHCCFLQAGGEVYVERVLAFFNQALVQP
jgi:fermentation-respiration switch protein FrsA (DUF1100 family)